MIANDSLRAQEADGETVDRPLKPSADASNDERIGAEAQPTQATTAIARFRTSARLFARASGASGALREEIEREIIDHLVDVFESKRSSGLAPEIAVQRALEAFGDPRSIRREFLLRGLARDARSAVNLPGVWALLLVLDASLPVLRPWAAGIASPFASSGAMWAVLRYFALAISLLWIGHSAFRLSWRLCLRFVRNPDGEWELAAGLGVFAIGFGLLLSIGPGAAFPAICDLIDRALGHNSAVALTTLAVGLSVSLAALVRDLRRSPDELYVS